MLDLRILGACGQIYEEANAILWTTNTLSFEDGPSLQEFIQVLHTTQRNKLTRMHIDVAWELISAEWWRASLLPSIVSKLNALQTLHLTFKQCQYINPSRFPQEALNLLSAMQTLALKNVTVVIGERLDSPDSEMLDDPNEHRWTIEQKREAAEGLRSSLLNR